MSRDGQIVETCKVQKLLILWAEQKIICQIMGTINGCYCHAILLFKMLACYINITHSGRYEAVALLYVNKGSIEKGLTSSDINLCVKRAKVVGLSVKASQSFRAL